MLRYARPLAAASDRTENDVDLYKTLVRLVSGGVGEGLDRLKMLALELDTADQDPDSVETVPLATDPAAMVLIGWMSEWPDRAEAALSTGSQMSGPFAKLIGVAYGTGAALAEATGVAGFVAEVTAPARQALSEEIDRLSKVGTAEYARGRVFAV